VRLLHLRRNEASSCLVRGTMCRVLGHGNQSRAAAVKAGRKPRHQSRGQELHQQLSAWKSRLGLRPSLRRLAHELGTSHQLLGHYLKTWTKWEKRNYERRAAEICGRAQTEDRYLTPSEELEATECDRAAFRAMVTFSVESIVNDLLKKIKTGHAPSKSELRLIRVVASNGFGLAKKILDLCGSVSAKNQRNNLPGVRGVFAKCFRSEGARLATPLKRAPAHAAVRSQKG
jgi:hypothetical protein